MIAFDFDYYKPEAITEAIDTYKALSKENKKVIYFAGGTEIVNQGRLNHKQFDAVIDIKGIPQCNALEFKKDKLIIGAAVSLTKIKESKLYPLLSIVCRRIADHTSRNMITIGGNVCGDIAYREAVLPLLLADSRVIIANDKEVKAHPLKKMFNKAIALNKGEFILQFEIDKNYIDLPFYHIKRTKQDLVDYPLLTIAAVKIENQIKIAVSGLYPYPCQFEIENCKGCVEDILLKRSSIVSDLMGTSEYRLFLARQELNRLTKQFGGQRNA